MVTRKIIYVGISDLGSGLFQFTYFTYFIAPFSGWGSCKNLKSPSENERQNSSFSFNHKIAGAIFIFSDCYCDGIQSTSLDTANFQLGNNIFIEIICHFFASSSSTEIILLFSISSVVPRRVFIPLNRYNRSKTFGHTWKCI